MSKVSHRQECLKSASKLKGTDIYLNEDVCKATLDIRRGKLDELKLKRRQGFIAYFSGTNIIVKERREYKQENGSTKTERTLEAEPEQREKQIVSDTGGQSVHNKAKRGNRLTNKVTSRS